MRYSTEMRCDHVEKGNGISKKSNELDVPGQGDLQAFALKSVLGLNNYLSAFWYFLAFGEGLGLFDLLVIDLLWWRSTKRIRFSFLPEKKYYQNPKKHIESFWRGIPLFAAAAALAALIVTVL